MLHGWIEIGLSNPNIFAGQSNPDIILRSYDTNNTNKIIIGNTALNDAPNRVAALYVLGNNVGFKKVPDTNIDVDINGMMSTTDARVASNLHIGYGTNSGFMQLRGDFQVINTDTSDLRITNNSNTVSFMYSNVERVKFTNGNGISLNDNVYVTNDVYSTGYHITSDSNFKEYITSSDCSQDLELLRRLDVCDFNFKGSVDRVKGLIAQNVNEVIPSAVTEITGIIPLYNGTAYLHKNVLVSANSDADDETNNHLWMLHLSSGDEIVLGTSSYSKEFIVKVASVDLATHRIMLQDILFPNEDDKAGKAVHVHGKIGKVKTIDPNQILALCVSAVQALVKRIDAM